jgi:hypothetical protein
MREGTTSRVVVVDNRPYGEFYDFYSISLEYFRYHIPHMLNKTHHHTFQNIGNQMPLTPSS